MTCQTALPRAALVLALAAALPLGGCKKDKEAGQTAAAGELLPRSVTDDMLPYDTIRSQAPLANPEAAKSGASTDHPAATASEAGTTAQEAATAEDAAQAGPVTPAAE